MARISAEQRQSNKDMYDAHIYEIFITEGWDAVTYDRLSKEFGVRKSTLQRYYPHRVDFGRALQGRIFPLIAKHLDFTSKENFVASWEKGLGDRFFSMVIKMLIQNATGKHTAEGSVSGMKRLFNVMNATMSEKESSEAVETALGKSVLYFMLSQKEQKE